MFIRYLFCMKKYFLAFIGCFILFSHVSAAEIFSHPVLTQAYQQVNMRIDAKVTGASLDNSGLMYINQNKQQLTKILHAIDVAFQKRNIVEIKRQAIFFRTTYQATISFLQKVPVTIVVTPANNTPVTTNNTNIVTGDTTITGTSTDITYYADMFEGRNTANGNIFSQTNFSAARCETPFNTLLQVGNNNTSVIVKVNDRPNCSKYPNVTDLSTIAF